MKAEAGLDGEVEDTGRHARSRKGTRGDLVEVVTRGERRRSWSAEQKRMIVVEAMQPGAKAAEVIVTVVLTPRWASADTRRDRFFVCGLPM